MTLPTATPPSTRPDGGGLADLSAAAAEQAAADERAARTGRLRGLRPRLPGTVRARRAGGGRSPRLVPPPPARDRFGPADLLAEAAHGIGARPGRLLLTIVGTVLGIGSLVVTTGLAQTAAGQISRQFDAVAATRVVVEPASARTASGERTIGRIPWDVEDRLGRIAGVELVGALGPVDTGDLEVTAQPVNDPSAQAFAPPAVVAATPGLLRAVDGRVVTGRWFDAGHDVRADRVVVLGARAAQRLGVLRVDRQPAIFIGDRPYAVIGVVDGVQRRSDLLDAVFLPVGTARADFRVSGLDQAHVRIAVGAGPVIAEQGPSALEPNNPEAVSVQVPPPPPPVRENVQADVNAIFLALGAVALLVGALGIANVTLLSVRERLGEIGLRRALGARTRDIVAQFLTESGVIGLLGGLIGASLGVMVVVGVSVAKQWTPILDTGAVVGAAALGVVIGLLAGAYPAFRAARIEPIAALRGTAH
ncbi:ABC transporter permease [Actinotalea sp. Marseille-Q4924]|uniref:ABC transporter permease n=1 Tax=Actinotalea sp. Marseille-Q4924 TaxID=2866571 RepID=UPI001CE44910|nr:ABC transporter permease [Actinotalea sp. Marseille-Q4924]